MHAHKFMTAPLITSIMNTQANLKMTSPGDTKDLKALYAQSFALVTPANKDLDEKDLLVPIKKEEDAASANTAKSDQSSCSLSSSTEVVRNTSPISQITHMDTQEHALDNIEPLPYNQDEQIALHGCLGNFLGLTDSPVQPRSSSAVFHVNEFGVDEEQLPSLPEVDFMSTTSTNPPPLYPPPPLHWPMPQDANPHPHYVYCNYGYAHLESHSFHPTNVHPSALTKQSSIAQCCGRKRSQIQIPPGDDQEYIQEATDIDVVCGRGGAINNHPGNRRFRDFINQLKYEYLKEPKQTKPRVAMRVLELVKPGRFLMKFPEGYLECSEDRAKEKASQALREGAAKLRKEGYGDEKETGPLKVKSVLLPNERANAARSGYSDDVKYCDQFEPPRPRKKPKRASM